MVEPLEAAPDDTHPGGRLWVGALIALAGAVFINLTIRWVALTGLDIPAEFPPLAVPWPAIFFTTVGTLGATGVFALIRRRSDRPDRVFLRVAVGVLLLSFIPDFWLLSGGAANTFPGATLSGVGTLMLMHVATAAVIVWALTIRGRAG